MTTSNGVVSSTAVLAGKKLTVSYIDVGQADSILIQTPGGKNVLIDAGNNEDANTIVTYLKGKNISRLDYVIATHSHEDHIGSMDTVINTFDIGNMVMPKETSNTQTFRDLLTAIANKGLKPIEAKAGVKLDFGSELNAELLAPNSTGYGDINDYSAVSSFGLWEEYLLVYGGCRGSVRIGNASSWKSSKGGCTKSWSSRL